SHTLGAPESLNQLKIDYAIGSLSEDPCT
ncbi:unnamed protein product, partial [Caretta caretta]